ncbi:MAG: hypothetical protein H6861_05945 [Rhodospirillales bacterium]|nr:hypothetical protein [Rhodospirillales bacterium]
MRIRTLVSSAAVLGTLLASSALVSEAMAQRGTVLAPSTGWAVSKVGNGGGAYCALARKYNQNTVLTVARNEDAETSFALDFQRPVLRPQGLLKVILDPGAGQQRAYEIKPVSNNAFVVRLGRDSAFFKALERTGLLRVEMNGQSYHFNMADLDQGQFKLDACVANLVIPAAGDEAEPLTPDMQQAEVDPGKSYRQEINTLRRQISSLQDQNEALKVQMETRNEGASEVGSSVAQLSAQIRTLEDANAGLKKELSEVRVSLASQASADVDTSTLENEIAALKAENSRLQASAQAEENVAQDVERIAALEAEVQSLQARNASLQDSVAAQGDGQALVRELQEQVDALERENTALNAKILAAREDIRGEFERQISALNEENAALKQTMENKGVDAQLLEQLRQQIAQAENENRLLQETATQARGDFESQMRAEKDVEIEKVRNEQAVRIAALENEVDGLKADNASKAKELLEIGEGTAVLAALREENAALKERMALQDAQRGQSDVLVQRVANLEDENAALLKQLDSLKDNAVQDVAAEDADAAKIAALESERDALKAQIAGTEAQSVRIQTLEAEVASLESVNEDLQTQIAAGDVNDELRKALGDNARLLAEIKDKDLQLVALETARRDLDEAKLKIAELETQPQGVDGASVERVAALEAQHREMKTALADLVEVSENYREENAQQKGRIQTLEGEVATLETENTTLKGALSEAEQNLEDAQRDLQDMAIVSEVRSQSEAPKGVEPSVAQDGPVAKQGDEVEVKQARVSVPLPMEKPVIEEVPPVQQVAEADEPVQTATQEITAGGRVAMALKQVEAEMHVTDPNDQARMQALAREYMALKALAEEQGVNVDVAPVSETTAAPVAEEPIYPDFSGMSEAQIQEQKMKMRQAVLVAEMLEGQDEHAVGAQDIMLSQSADPFVDMQVEEADQSVETEGWAFEADADAISEASEVAESVGQRAVAQVYGTLSIQDLITQAQVSTPDKIKKVGQGVSADAVAYQWNGGRIYGSAEQKHLEAPEQFDALVQSYLERTQNRCPGEFAVVPDNTMGGGDMRVDSYEVACVGSDVSSGASLLFFNQGDTFTVVAHEAPAEELGEAMGMRNKVMRFITTGS